MFNTFVKVLVNHTIHERWWEAHLFRKWVHIKKGWGCVFAKWAVSTSVGICVISLNSSRDTLSFLNLSHKTHMSLEYSHFALVPISAISLSLKKHRSTHFSDFFRVHETFLQLLQLTYIHPTTGRTSFTNSLWDLTTLNNDLTFSHTERVFPGGGTWSKQCETQVSTCKQYYSPSIRSGIRSKCLREFLWLQEFY